MALFGVDDVVLDMAFGNSDPSSDNDEEPRELTLTQIPKPHETDLGTIKHETQELNHNHTRAETNSMDEQTFEDKENLDSNCQIPRRNNNSTKNVFKRPKSNSKTKDYVKFDIKESIMNMVEGTKKLSQKDHSKSIQRSKISSSKSRSKSIPKPETLKQQPQSVNITQVNPQKQAPGILKKTEPLKRIGSERKSKGPGSIASNRGDSVKSETE